MFMCKRTEEGKGFVIIEGKYKTVRSDRTIQVEIINVYSSESNTYKFMG